MHLPLKRYRPDWIYVAQLVVLFSLGNALPLNAQVINFDDKKPLPGPAANASAASAGAAAGAVNGVGAVSPAPAETSTAGAVSAPSSAVTSSATPGATPAASTNDAVPSEPSSLAPGAVAAIAPKPPENVPPKEMPAAMKLYNAGKFALAQKQFENFINTGVADEATHMNLAYCLYYQRKYTQALKQFDWVNKNAKHSVSMQMKAQATAAAIRSCMNGICPGQCLKPSDPRWREMPNLGGGKWIKWSMPNGMWKAYSEHHMGHVIQMVDGLPTDVGSCPICGGTGTVMPLKDGGALPGG